MKQNRFVVLLLAALAVLLLSCSGALAEKETKKCETCNEKMVLSFGPEVCYYYCNNSSCDKRFARVSTVYHSNEAATINCGTQGACSQCDHIVLDGTKHTAGDAATCTTAQVCTRAGCGAVIKAALRHSAGDPATCTTAQTCTRAGCDYVFRAALGHEEGDPATCTTAQVCTRVGCTHVFENKLGHDTSGDEATCLTPQICARAGCGAVIQEKLGHDTSGDEATCTSDQICARAGCGAVIQEKLGHEKGDPATCTTAQVCTRANCDYVFENKLGHIAGAAATCTTAQVCTRANCGAVIQEKLGHDTSGAAATCTSDQICARAGCGAVVQAALGHAHEADITPATCDAPGLAVYTCARCQDTYQETLAQRVHWYGDWTPNGDGTHSAVCGRCGHVKTADCAMTAQAGAGALCLVCGATEAGERLTAVGGAAAEGVDAPLPKGELVLLRGALEDGAGSLCVAYEYAGERKTLSGTVRVKLPAAEFEGMTLLLLAGDGSEIEIPVTLEDGMLVFELTFPEEGAQMMMIRLAEKA